MVGVASAAASAAVFGPSALSIGLPLAILLMVLVDGIARPSSSVLCPTLSRVERCGNYVALTFDDGPDPVSTGQVVDILNEGGARGTFFVIGRLLEGQLDVARRALEGGHELANHSWQHAYLQSMYPSRTLARDVDSADRLLHSLDGRAGRHLYRAPIGIKSPPLARVAKDRGITVVAWSIHSRDTIDSNPQRVADRVLRRIKPGDIVLMHDGHDREGRHRACAVQALPFILAGLKERNLQSVTVSELMARGKNEHHALG